MLLSFEEEYLCFMNTILAYLYKKILVNYYCFSIYKRNVIRESVFNKFNQLIWKPYFILHYTSLKKCILYSYISWHKHLKLPKPLYTPKTELSFVFFLFFIQKQTLIYEHLILTNSQWTLRQFSCIGSKKYWCNLGKEILFHGKSKYENLFFHYRKISH